MNKLFSSILIFISLTIFSCEKVDITDDTQVIDAIVFAEDKATIDINDLPEAATTILQAEYSDSYSEEINIASEWGYEVNLRREGGSRLGERYQVYFNLEGRRLQRTRNTQGGLVDPDRDRRDCFELNYPITLIMPDGTTISRSSEREIAQAMRRWYEANPRRTERPRLQYPVTITFNDRSTATIDSDEGLDRVRESCD